jgi:hypothetical protein
MPNLVNAGKYFASILVIVFTYFRNTYETNEYLYAGFYVFATLYAFAWDMTMDWGLF